MAAAFTASERTIRATGVITDIPDYDVSRLSYYLCCATVSCGVDIIVDELVDYKNVHLLPKSRQDAIFQLATEEFKVTEVLNKTIFLDEDGTLCGKYGNEFLELKNVTNLLAVASEAMVAGKVVEVTKIMVFKESWIENNYFAPLRRNKERLLRANPALLLAKILDSIQIEDVTEEESDHCDHCKGRDAACSCKRGCPVKSSTKCSAMHHCDHCKGIAGGVCACEHGCQEGAHSRCVVVHEIVSCDACKAIGIRGSRYKCSECSNYDLCQGCYRGGKHDETHPFHKIERVGSKPVLLEPRRKPQKFFDSLRKAMATKAESSAKHQSSPTSSSKGDPSAPVAGADTRSYEESKFVGDTMTIRQMKSYLAENNVSIAGAAERMDVLRLVWETQIEMMGAKELNAFVNAQNIRCHAGMTISAKRAAAVGAFDEFQRRKQAAKQPEDVKFALGQTVQLFGLQKQDMNGIVATVTRSELVSGRVQVRPCDDHSKLFNIRPENLRAAAEDLD